MVGGNLKLLLVKSMEQCVCSLYLMFLVLLMSPVQCLEQFMNHQSDQNHESGKVGLIRMLGMHSSASLFMELMAGAR